MKVIIAKGKPTNKPHKQVHFWMAAEKQTKKNEDFGMA